MSSETVRGWETRPSQAGQASLASARRAIDATFQQLLEDYRPGMNLIGVEPANTDRGPGGVGIVSPEVMLAAGDCRRYRLTLRVWPGLRHEIFNEPEQAEVLGVLTSWLDARH